MSAHVNKRGRLAPTSSSDVTHLAPLHTDSSSSSSSDHSMSEDIDQSVTNQTEIQVEFEARTPGGGDFHGIRRLLQQLFLKARVDLGALTEILLAQGSEVGSVIKQSEVSDEEEFGDGVADDDDHVFGISSVINLSDRFKDTKCIKQLVQLLLERGRTTANDRTQKLLAELLAFEPSTTGHDIGFLLNERFVNIPPQIAGPLYENLCKEMQAANKKGQKFKFDYYIFVSKLYKAQASRNRKKRGSGGGSSGVMVDVFSNAEDELFFERESIAWFEYSVANESDSGLDGDWDADDDVGMIPFRRVAIIPADEFSAIISKIRETFAATVTT